MTTTPLNLSNGCNGDRESCPLTSIQCLWLTRGECVWVWPVPTQGLPTPHWPLPAARQSSLAAATFSLSLPLSHPLNLTFYIFQLIQYIPLRTKLAKLSTTFIFTHNGSYQCSCSTHSTFHSIPFSIQRQYYLAHEQDSDVQIQQARTFNHNNGFTTVFKNKQFLSRFLSFVHLSTLYSL